MGVMRVMCMGDSITCGENGGYRVELELQLLESGIAVEFVGSQESLGRHEGYPGFKIGDLADGKESEEYGCSRPIEVTLQEYQPDALLILLGTNDMYHARAQSTFSELRSLVMRCCEFMPELDVFLGTILRVYPGHKPWGDCIPADVIRRVGQYNELIRSYCKASQQTDHPDRLYCVDISKACQSLDDLVCDGVHPKVETYSKIAGIWHEAITSRRLSRQV